MTIIDETWEALRHEVHNEHGWHVRRVYLEAPCEIMAGIQKPGSLPGLLIEVSIDEVPAASKLPKSRGFEVDPVLLGGGAAGRVRFALKLSDPAYEPVFSVLCDDAARAAASESRPRAAFRAWINRLHVWQEFMARHGTQGLNESAAIGLLGELLIMRNIIVPISSIAAAVQAWSGPLGEPNDFAVPRGFVEVKATIRQAPELIEISGMDQLDDTRGTIILVHARLRPSSEGECLPQVIATLRSALARDAGEYLRKFDQLLMNAGYIDAQADFYDRSYYLQSVEFFHVTNAFPRIRRLDLCDGIRGINYTVELAACAPCSVDQQQFARLLWT